MAVTPPSNTARFKVLYTFGLHQHANIIRTAPISPSAFGTAYAAWLSDLDASNLMQASVVDEVQFAASGSNIFNPVVSGIEGLGYGDGTLGTQFNAYYIDFVGRTSGGKRARSALFGVKTLGDNYRFSPGEFSGVDDAITLMNSTTGLWLGIDGLKPVWKSYANAGVNAYWQKNLR